MKRVFLISVDDWEQVYVDGVCVHSGHSVPDFVWLRIIGMCGGSTNNVYLEDLPEEVFVEGLMEEAAKKDWEEFKNGKT